MFEFEAVDDAGGVAAVSDDTAAYALRIRGDALYPALRDGQYVVVEPSRPCVPGELVCVEKSDGKTLIAELVQERPDAIVVVPATGGDRMVIERGEMLRAHPITSIVAPSRWVPT